jgi:hypothetical protein
MTTEALERRGMCRRAWTSKNAGDAGWIQETKVFGGGLDESSLDKLGGLCVGEERRSRKNLLR